MKLEADRKARPGAPKRLLSVKDAIVSVADKLNAKIMNSKIMQLAMKAVNYVGTKLIVLDAIMQTGPIVLTLTEEFSNPGTTKYAGLTPDDFSNGDIDKIVKHTEFSRDVGAAVGHVLGGVAGGWLGMSLLGAAGTLLIPGVGTAVGGVTGSLMGYKLGSKAGEYLGRIITDILAGREVELIRNPDFLAKLEAARKSLDEKGATPENVQTELKQSIYKELQESLGGGVNPEIYKKPEESIFDRRMPTPTQLEVQDEYQVLSDTDRKRIAAADALMAGDVTPTSIAEAQESSRYNELQRALAGRVGTTVYGSGPKRDERPAPTSLEVQDEYKVLSDTDRKRIAAADALMAAGVMPGDEAREINREKLKQLNNQAPIPNRGVSASSEGSTSGVLDAIGRFFGIGGSRSVSAGAVPAAVPGPPPRDVRVLPPIDVSAGEPQVRNIQVPGKPPSAAPATSTQIVTRNPDPTLTEVNRQTNFHAERAMAY